MLVRTGRIFPIYLWTLNLFGMKYVISIFKVCTYCSKLVLWARSTRIGVFRFLFHIVEFSVFHYFRYQVRGCVIFAGSFISVMALGRPKDNYLRKSLFDNLVGISLLSLYSQFDFKTSQRPRHFFIALTQDLWKPPGAPAGQGLRSWFNRCTHYFLPALFCFRHWFQV